jgi:hypothetical protein
MEGTKEHSFITKLLDSAGARAGIAEVGDGFFLMGGIVRRVLSETEFSAIAGTYGILSYNVNSYTQVCSTYGHCYMYGSQYTRMSKRDQSVVKYQCPESEEIKFGRINYFIQFTDVHDICQNLALVTPLECKYNHGQHVHSVSEVDQIVPIPVSCLKYVCIFIAIDNKRYICEFPNIYERD